MLLHRRSPHTIPLKLPPSSYSSLFSLSLSLAQFLLLYLSVLVSFYVLPLGQPILHAGLLVQ